MRKRYILFLAIALAVLFTGCFGGAKVSDKAISVGKQAISIVDDYLDGNATYDTVSDKLSELKDQMAYVDDMDADDEYKIGDFSVSVKLTSLSHDLLMDHYNGTNETYDNIIEDRNELAEKIGEKKR